MFYRNIGDTEAGLFHDKLRVNSFLKELPEDEDSPFLDNGDGRIAPLFYSEEIENPYDNVRVLDNKLLISLEDLEDIPFIHFKSEVEVTGIGVLWSLDNVNSEWYLDCTFYDRGTGFNLNEHEVSFSHSVSGVVVDSGSFECNKYGNVLIPLTTVTGKVSLTIEDHTISFSLSYSNSLFISVTGEKLKTNYSTLSVDSGSAVWGDGTETNLNGTVGLNHTFTDGVRVHEVNVLEVTGLGDNCFRGCDNVDSVIVPSGVTSLGNNCFYGCTGLSSIILPEELTSLSNNCFNSCSSLTSIILPEGLTSLGIRCFYRCSSLTSTILPEGLTSLGSDCFSRCSSLTSISLPDTLTSLGESCFDNTRLTSLIIPDGVTSIGNSCFRNSKLTDITLPSNITSLGFQTFLACKNLTSIVIPDGVTSLGAYCFAGCTSLNNIRLPDTLTSLGESCFNGCTSLTELNIPSNVTSIDDKAFTNNDNLTIHLNWSPDVNIIPYNDDWVTSTSNVKFQVNPHYRSRYLAAGYPANRLI